MSSFARSIVILIALMAGAGRAFAQSAPPADPTLSPGSMSPGMSPAAPKSVVEWYGWRILLVDTVALVLTVRGADQEGPALGYLGLSTYVLGGPIVHAERGNWGRAGLSAGLRLALPVAGFAVFDATERDCEDECYAGLIGGGLGIVAAMVVDAVAIARDRRLVVVDDDEPPPSSPWIAPTVGLDPARGFSLGLAGEF